MIIIFKKEQNEWSYVTKKVNDDNNLNTEGVAGQFHKCHCSHLIYVLHI
jgi:hypothetical protein